MLIFQIEPLFYILYCARHFPILFLIIKQPSSLVLCGCVKYKERAKCRDTGSCPVSNSRFLGHSLGLTGLKQMDLLINPYVFDQQSLSIAMPSSTQHLVVGICSYSRIKALWFVFPVFRLWVSLEKLGSHQVYIYSWLKILPMVNHHLIDNLRVKLLQVFLFLWWWTNKVLYCSKDYFRVWDVLLWLQSISVLNSINIGFKFTPMRHNFSSYQTSKEICSEITVSSLTICSCKLFKVWKEIYTNLIEILIQKILLRTKNP